MSGLHGMAMEGIRSSDASPRLDPMEQFSAHMNEIKNQFHNILAAIPLPAKGPAVQGEGLLLALLI